MKADKRMGNTTERRPLLKSRALVVFWVVLCVVMGGGRVWLWSQGVGNIYGLYFGIAWFIPVPFLLWEYFRRAQRILEPDALNVSPSALASDSGHGRDSRLLKSALKNKGDGGINK